ncbi:hypothetical protein BGW80DRAFT_871020 [Lactifluus volemus]|nr:hypothetical protein BGW80DRAFT_871020 [Lactifluus volemus]
MAALRSWLHYDHGCTTIMDWWSESTRRLPMSSMYYVPMPSLTTNDSDLLKVSNVAVNDFPAITIHTDSTLSSWCGNMSKLSSLIDQLRELATTAPEEHQPQLRRQVTALSKEFTKQRRRHAKFSKLRIEYANRFLLDISEEIHQQSSFLDALEKRLAMARGLRSQAVDLRKSFEDGTWDRMKKVRRTVLSQPLLEDHNLFKEIDAILNEIQRCYIEMDKFWVDEVHRASRALNCRRLDPEDIDRWRRFREGLDQNITETGSPEGVGNTILYLPIPIPRKWSKPHRIFSFLRVFCCKACYKSVRPAIGSTRVC